MDKGAATRFIKNAIAQVKLGRPPGENNAQPGPSNEVRVPVRVTSKMLAREEYQSQLREQGSEEEEDEEEGEGEEEGEYEEEEPPFDLDILAAQEMEHVPFI